MKATLVSLTGIIRGVPTDEQKSAPVHGLPEGAKIRFRFRNDDFARCFVKTPHGIKHYIPEFIDGAWILNPKLQQGENIGL